MLHLKLARNNDAANFTRFETRVSTTYSRYFRCGLRGAVDAIRFVRLEEGGISNCEKPCAGGFRKRVLR